VISFKIKIAEFVFEIETNFSDTKEMCKDYLTDENSDFLVSINKEDLVYEKEKSIKEAIYEGITPEEFSDAYLETIAVYRKIAEYISVHSASVFHGCLVSLNNEGYLFTGRSGIGKSTHVNNWVKMYPDCIIVNGDKPILKIVGDDVIGFGTPWSGKENLNTNSSVKLKAIIVLTRDLVNHIEKISINDALPSLLSSTYRSSSNNGIKNALEFVAHIGSKVELYKLGCNMDKESAKVDYEGMNS